MLPPPLRPSIARRMLLVLGGVFFLTAAVVSSYVEIPKLRAALKPAVAKVEEKARDATVMSAAENQAPKS